MTFVDEKQNQAAKSQAQRVSRNIKRRVKWSPQDKAILELAQCVIILAQQIEELNNTTVTKEWQPDPYV